MKESTKIKLQAGVTRALRTFGQATLGSLAALTGSTTIAGQAIDSINFSAIIGGLTWPIILTSLSSGLMAAIIAILMSLQTLPEVADAVAEAKEDEKKVEAVVEQAKADAVKELEEEKAKKAEIASKVEEAIAMQEAVETIIEDTEEIQNSEV